MKIAGGELEESYEELKRSLVSSLKKFTCFQAFDDRDNLWIFVFFFMCVDKNLGMFILYQTVRIV